MATTTKSAPVTGGGELSVWQTWYRTAPVLGGVLALALGLLGRTLETRQFVAGLAILVFTFGMLIRHRCYSRRRKDRQNAVFLSFVLIAFVAIISVIRFSLLRWGWIVIALIAGVGVLGLFWWLSQQNVRRVEFEKELDAWPEFAEKIGLKAVRRGALKVTETGRRVWLAWDRDSGVTIPQVESHLGQLGNYFEIPFGQAKLVKHVEGEEGFISPNGIWLVENTQSAIHKQTVEFTEPTMTSIYDEMLIGPTEDNNLIKVAWYIKGWGGKHTISGGKTGSGKSSLFDLTFAESARCRDVVRWGMDRKGGSALIPWAPMFDWVAITDQGCMAMLSALKEVLEYRGKVSGERGWRYWKASPKHPVIVVILDEAAEILALNGATGWDAAALAASAARRARSLGVILFFAVQHLNLDSIGSTQITNNCDRRFCFAMKTSAQQQSVIAHSQGAFDATQVELPKKAGTFWWTDGGEPSGVAARVRFVNETKIREIVTMVGDDTTDLDRDSAKAAQKGSEAFGDDCYDKRKRWLLEDLPPVGGTDEDEEEEDWDDEEPEDGTEDGDGRGDPTVGETEDGPDTAAPAAAATPGPTQNPDGTWVVPDIDKVGETTVGSMVGSQDQEVLRAEIDEFMAARYPTPKVAEVDAVRLLDEALDKAGAAGVARKDLVALTGWGPTWVYEQMAKRLQAGQVESVGEGKSTRYRRPAAPVEAAPPLRLVRV